VTYPSWAEYYVAHNAVQYAQFLERLPEWLDRTKPEIVFYQAGMDCWEQDGVGGIDGVTAEFLSGRDRFVLGHLMQREIPTVINLGGGYETHSPELHVLTARIAADLLWKKAQVPLGGC
jgi:acetoin utilization deacetylase AcuC-like enzyme